MDKIQALTQFWSQFGLTAYDETTVPDKAPFPYLTYEVAEADFGNERSASASLWYYSTSWSDITQKAEEIYSYIGRGGRIVLYDGGGLWIKRDNMQRMGESDMIRRYLINYIIEFID